jgi:DNA-binding LacI/PurR family transcriptional regulator
MTLLLHIKVDDEPGVRALVSHAIGLEHTNFAFVEGTQATVLRKSGAGSPHFSIDGGQFWESI